MTHESVPLLEVRGLSVDVIVGAGRSPVVEDLAFAVFEGETLGIVGESGSGKSISVRALLGLIASPPLRVTGGSAMFRGRDLLAMRPRELGRLRGSEIAMIFQDPLASLNPLQRCGAQIEEALRTHSRLDRSGRRRRAVDLLRSVGIPDPENRVDRYPHEFSGGMRQRVMIAIALANEPRLLVADEPTTALDVTIQAQVMELLRDVGRQRTVSLILISHDLGLIAENTQRVLVMYAGRAMEIGATRDVLAHPAHPYTQALLRARPDLTQKSSQLTAIPGRPPAVGQKPSGCPFHPRCAVSRGRSICVDTVPDLRPVNPAGRLAACHFAEELGVPTADVELTGAGP